MVHKQMVDATGDSRGIRLGSNGRVTIYDLPELSSCLVRLEFDVNRYGSNCNRFKTKKEPTEPEESI